MTARLDTSGLSEPAIPVCPGCGGGRWRNREGERRLECLACGRLLAYRLPQPVGSMTSPRNARPKDAGDKERAP